MSHKHKFYIVNCATCDYSLVRQPLNAVFVKYR